MKKLSVLLALLSLTAILSGCNAKNPASSAEPKSIVGTWKIVSVKWSDEEDFFKGSAFAGEKAAAKIVPCYIDPNPKIPYEEFLEEFREAKWEFKEDGFVIVLFSDSFVNSIPNEAKDEFTKMINGSWTKKGYDPNGKPIYTIRGCGKLFHDDVESFDIALISDDQLVGKIMDGAEIKFKRIGG